MQYQVNGNCPGIGGWSMTLEAESPEAALARAMANEATSEPQNPNYPRLPPATEITVRPYVHVPQQAQTAYGNCLMSVPDALLTVTRGPQRPNMPFIFGM